MKRGFLALLFLLALDVVSKAYADAFLPGVSGGNYPFGGVPIFYTEICSFSLNYAANTGAAWGMFQGYSGLLFGIRCATILGLIGYLTVSRKRGPREIALWVIVTGAVGNVIDYLLYGHVIDFFHFTFFGKSFPIFNVADSCITLGVLWLLFFKGERVEKRA